MKKYLILFLMIPFILLVGCQTKTQAKKLEYNIENDAEIEVIYYEKLSTDQSLSHYDTLQLTMTGEQLCEYPVFQNLIKQAKQSEYDQRTIILGIPIGWYEQKLLIRES